MKIGLLGMGTIGSGVFEIAQKLDGVEVKKVLEKRFQADYITDKIEEITTDPEIELVISTFVVMAASGWATQAVIRRERRAKGAKK